MGITIKAVAPGFFGPPPNVAEDFSAIFKWLIEEKGSEELKAFEQYSSRTGDEGELRDKDGSFICDEEGWPHQDWKNSKWTIQKWHITSMLNGYLKQINMFSK